MKLEVNAKKCVGCRICELICSFHHCNCFSPEKSDIRVSFDKNYNLTIKTNVLSTCDYCGMCIEACPTGAVSIK